MNVLITGGTGLIGGALIEQLRLRGITITVYTRDPSHFDTDNIHYVNSLEAIDEGARFDAFFNLAGEPLNAKRWSEERKAELVASRVGTTRALLELAQRLEHKPALLISASAIGYYGHQGDEYLSEQAAQVDGFSHRLCLAWEQEAQRFDRLGVRVCIARLGVVLARDQGAMPELCRSAKWGIGSWLGDGRQWLSWVHIDDAVASLLFLLDDPSLAGAFNVTALEPVTNRQFCDQLASHLDLLVKLPVPAMVMQLALGEVANELLLKGQRVVPRRLQEAGFQFHYATLAEALPDLLD